MLTAVVLALAVGTYGFRLGGVLLAGRLTLPDWLRTTLPIAAAVLLAALAATSAVMQGKHFAGWARPSGVLVGIVLALRRAPFVAVVAGGAATAAFLRLLGVP